MYGICVPLVYNVLIKYTISLMVIDNTFIKEIKLLRTSINKLEVCEHIEIFKILVKNGIKFTENNNGIFINMNKLTPKCIEEINNFLIFINSNLNRI